MESLNVWREPVRGGYPDPPVLGWPGLESMRKALEIGGPLPPLAHLTGLMLSEVEPDRVVFTMPASEWFLSSQGRISGGALTMLVDAALGCAVGILLPAATPYTTAELSITFLRPAAAEGILKAVGTPLDDGRPLSLSQAWIEDSGGRRVAFATSSCFVLPRMEGLEPPDDLAPFVPPAYESPDPYIRPAVGETIPWDLWRTMPGLQILERQIAGELPPPPIHYLTGLTLRAAESGRVTFTMPASRWLTSPLGTIQGGALAMLAQSALTMAVASTLETGSAYRPVDVKVNFLRPGVADDTELTATGEVRHRGRTLAVAHSTVVNAAGKPLVTATGSTMILPERPS